MRKRATPPSRDRQREETRNRLFAAALETFRRDGVTECRIDDIASAAGVSRASFYFHFPTKEDVLLELQRRTDERVAATVRALPAQAELLQVLDGLGTALSEVWAADAKLFPDVAVAFLRVGAATMVTDREYGAVRMALAERFRQAAQRGELQAVLTPDLLSDVFLCNVLGGMLGWCAQPIVPLKQVLEVVTHLFLHGVQAPAAQKAPRRGRKRGAEK